MNSLLAALTKAHRRRHVLMPIVPVLCLAAWVLGRGDEVEGLYLWTVSSAAIGFSAVVLSPVLAGLAAWAGQTASRARVTGLLASSPRSRLDHDLGLLMATLLILGSYFPLYLLFQLVQSLRLSTFGILDPAPIFMGATMVFAAISIGYCIGVWSDRLSSPIFAAIVLAVLQLGFPALMPSSSLRYLSGLDILGVRSGGVIGRYWPAVSVPFAAWMIGLGGIAIGLIVMRGGQWKALAVAGLATMSAVAIAGAGGLAGLPADFNAIERERISYEPICETADAINLRACVHPAYEPFLDETLEVGATVWTPVAGLPGIPTEIFQFPNLFGATDDELVEPLPIYFLQNGKGYLATDYAMIATNYVDSEAQGVVALWLASPYVPVDEFAVQSILGRIRSSGGSGGSDGSATDARAQVAALQEAYNRFASLDETTRRAWLEANWSNLRAANLTMSDLP